MNIPAKITVLVRTRARQDSIVPGPAGEGDGRPYFIVSTHAAPHEGEANDAVAALVAKYFHVSRSAVRIVSGKTFKKKVIEIWSKNDLN